MSEAPKPPNTQYEEATWHRFRQAVPFTKTAFLAWRDEHRAALLRLFGDPRMTEDAKQAVRDLL